MSPPRGCTHPRLETHHFRGPLLNHHPSNRTPSTSGSEGIDERPDQVLVVDTVNGEDEVGVGTSAACRKGILVVVVLCRSPRASSRNVLPIELGCARSLPLSSGYPGVLHRLCCRVDRDCGIVGNVPRHELEILGPVGCYVVRGERSDERCEDASASTEFEDACVRQGREGEEGCGAGEEGLGEDMPSEVETG